MIKTIYFSDEQAKKLRELKEFEKFNLSAFIRHMIEIKYKAMQNAKSELHKRS